MSLPLCPLDRHDAWLRPVVDRLVSAAVETCGAKQVQAVILAGSLARGEASVIDVDAGPRLLGDVELLVILRLPFDLAVTRRRLRDLAQRLSRESSAPGRPLAVDYVPAGEDYLRRNIRPCIFAFDLKTHGRVLWGEADMLARLQPVAAGDIPRGDAVTLVMNRSIELLLLDLAIGAPESEHLQIAYHLEKTMLDLAGSALAFSGRYRSLYSERNDEFGALVQAEADLGAALSDRSRFMRELAAASECKLRPSRQLLLRGDLRGRYDAVLRWAAELWTWEMRRWVDMPDASFRELVRVYLRRQGGAARLKGWVKYWRHPLRPRRPLGPLQAGRLLMTASPQALTYAAAMLLVGSRLERRSEWAIEAAALLPGELTSNEAATLRETGEIWTWLIRNN